jgi:hypothetical protein
MDTRADWNCDCLSVCAETRCRRTQRSLRAQRLLYGAAPVVPRGQRMTQADTAHDGTIEQCLDELNDFAAGLTEYSPHVLAVALRIHLEGLLRALLTVNLCTREEVRVFVRELERDALQYEED